MASNNNFITGVFNDDEIALSAAKLLRENNIKIHEVYSPFPIHGIDDVLGYKRSRLPRVAFLFGTLGLLIALVMQFWMMGIDWPMIIGGKDFASLPPFIPVTFELTVLISALGMVGVFMLASNLKPYKKPRIFDLRITDDKHVIAIDLEANNGNEVKIKEVLTSGGAEEVNEITFE
ncbi:DUF3341 domain-containing protein [Bacteroidota bacterium]